MLSARTARRRARSAAAVAILAAGAGALGAAGGEERAAAADGARPNFVVVMTDDQTQAALAAMPRTRALIGDAGVTFENSFVSFPLCCPSRATFLTGQYTHNHGVRNNYVPQGGFQLLRTEETLPVWLSRAGYTTAMVGKLMNGYNASPVGVPPGWSEWHGEKTENRYYGYQLLEDGSLVTYGDPDEDPSDPADPGAYSSDVYTAKAVDFIGREAPAADPFFLWVSYNAPHSGLPDPPAEVDFPCRGHAKPAARHIGAFAAEPLPRPPSFNEADVSDKPRSVRGFEPFTAADVAAIERIYRCELESLLAVDEGVEAIVEALGATGELDRTYLIFTSDNGFLHGQHRFVYGKHRIYEEALRVPLLISGPRLPQGETVEELVANVDLSPTILDAAGAMAALPQDGRSLLRTIRRPARRLGREILIDTNRYRGIRNQRYSYVEYFRPPDKGEVELYDLERDPHQLESLDRDRDYRDVEKALAKRVKRLMRCDGRECRERPRLELDEDGPEPCSKRAVEVVLGGRDADDAVRVRFLAGGRAVRTDRRAPFRARLPRKALRRSGGRLVAEVDLIDGRLATVRERVRC